MDIDVHHGDGKTNHYSLSYDLSVFLSVST